MLLCLDYGHRGSNLDYGACAYGYKESELVLSIGKKVLKKITGHGVKCLETRGSEDDVVSLNERVLIANKNKATHFISIHINSASNSDGSLATKATGIETFIYKSTLKGSKEMADSVQKRLIEYTGAVDRGVKEGNFAVIRDTNMDAILIECGFISNPSEADLLAMDEYQEKLACAISKGFLESVGIEYKEDVIDSKGDDNMIELYKKTAKVALKDIMEVNVVIENKTMKQVFDKYKPDIILNGTLYDMASGKTITNTVDENVAHGYLFSKEGIGIKNRKELVWTTFDNAKKDNTIFDFLGGSPTLVKEGKKYVDASGTVSDYVLKGTHLRSFLGFNKTHLFLCCSMSNNTIDSLASYCINTEKMEYAINLDGGGSCGLGVKNGSSLKIISSSSRANANWVLVYLNKKTNVDNSTKVESGVKADVITGTLGKTKVCIDGKVCETSSVVIDGRTLITLRDFEQAGYKIGYKSINGVMMATIDKPQ